MSKNATIAGLLTAMVIFLVITAVCVASALSPVIETERDMMGQIVRVNEGLNTQQGVILLRQAWLTFPDYNTGLAVIAVAGLIGASICGYMVGRIYYAESLDMEMPVEG